MTVYPYEIDSDQNIIRVDDNVTEVGGESINQLRDAVFAIETELGIQPAGSAGSVASRLDVAHNPDGSIKASALTSVGLATLPIVDNQVATNAGIKEYKLALDYTTSDLHTLITANAALLSSLTAFTNSIFSDLSLHIAGANLLTDGSTSARHTLSHIDINAVPSDDRDPSFVWDGLRDKTGSLRTATQAAEALQQINDDLVDHENAVADAHVATAVSVDVSEFTEIPITADTAQKVFQYLDDAEVLNMGQHRATQHANAIPKIARSVTDVVTGRSTTVVASTTVYTYLVHAPNTGPVDDLSIGDDVVKFVSDNDDFAFDAQFSQVRVGDIITIDYGNGTSTSFPVESIRFVPGVEWIIRINGVNLFESTDGYASATIERALYDSNTVGVLAVASANASSLGDPGSFTDILQSVIVGNPRGATAYGLGFDAGQLNSTHYNLYLEMYPTGNPEDRVISLPAVDVTGNAGATPGNYDLDTVVQNINNKFREIGYNYRFIAFAHAGELGIMLADAINNVSFAIINGSNSSGTLETSVYTDNVIGGNDLDEFDALGFGSLGANLASPAYQATWVDETAAQIPTKIIAPLKRRNYIVNGQRRDTFAATYLANSDGYWDGYISARTPVGLFTVEVTYTINLDLSAAKLKPGKTIVVQPTVDFSDGLYSDVDYGRFIIKDVVFVTCPAGSEHTEITVINGIHATGAGFGFSSLPDLAVKIYFGEDSVDFDVEEVLDQSPTPDEYHRLHEIFINDSGVTFSHERARLPRQVEDPNKLSTDNLHIVSVSPKLRGYPGDDATILNKFVRFYLLSYDTTSGEFDGYLGQPSGTDTILRPGPVTTGRKNVVTRFYDETYNDYVDLVFNEVAVSPGVDLLSTAVPRYVDIELFPSLQLDDELLVLATCEVNWSPASGQFIVQNVRDARQFGSVDELDFTDSAIDFISAGDRLLHTNGVITGLELDSISSVPDSGEIFFKGGVALVNGRIATVNNMSVTIPQVYDSSSSLPQDLEWAVCVNEFNNLVPIPVTSTKMQLFATAGSSNYYIPSVTFSELVATRKDLTVIALVSVTIASLTVNDVIDARRFVFKENYSNTLTLTSPEIPGNFHSFEAAIEWLTRLGGERSKVTISGIFDIDESIDLSDIDQTVIFEGDGATLNVTAAQGIILGSNMTLKNIAFTYDPADLTYDSGDLVNSGNGCIYAAPVGFIRNFYIENCSFSCDIAGSQRPPFINIVLTQDSGITNSAIRDNTFFDDTSTVDQAVIAIINDNSGSGEAATVVGLNIEHNRTNSRQGIYLTTATSSDTQERPGLATYTTSIRDNTCGAIGILNSNVFVTAAAGAVNSLVVENNRCLVISSLDDTGKQAGGLDAIEYGTGNVIVQNNACSWIHILTNDIASETELFCTAKISGNIVQASANAVLDKYEVSGDGSLVDSGIMIYSFNPSTEQTMVVITGNTLKFGYVPTLAGYTIAGIFCMTSAIITDNVIRCLATNATAGIICDAGTATSALRRHVITGNQIHRLGVTIDSYITINEATVNDCGVISNNVFDLITTNGSAFVNQIVAPEKYLVTQNKNHVQVHRLHSRSGLWSFGNVNVVIAGVNTSSDSFISANSATSAEYNHDTSPGVGEIVVWSIPLLSVLPYGVSVVKVEADMQIDDAAASTKTWQMTVTGASTDDSDTGNLTGSLVTYTLTCSSFPVCQDSGSDAPELELVLSVTNTDGTCSVFVQDVLIYYFW